jgi:voltage-gated potassium channel Kch
MKQKLNHILLIQPLKGRFFFLLLFLVLFLVLYPYLWHVFWGRRLMSLILMAVLLACVFSMRENRTVFYVGIVLSTPAVLAWFTRFLLQDTPILEFVGIVTLVPFFAYAVVTTLHRVLKAETITWDELFGVAALYLLLGITWCTAYGVLEYLHPGNFNIQTDGWPDLIYFSFVTLTSLGYGDMVPVTDPARSLAILESVTGVLYIAILIARMVSAYVHTSAGVREIVSEAGDKKDDATEGSEE